MLTTRVKERARRLRSDCLLLLLSLFAIVGCDGTVYHRFASVEGAKWVAGDTLSFLYEGDDFLRWDSLCSMQLSVQLRCNSSFKYKGLWVRAESYALPGDSLLSVDTLFCRVYDENGRHIGSTAGLLFQNESNVAVVDASPGDTMEVRVTHIMPDVVLRGVSDVGIKLSTRLK